MSKKYFDNDPDNFVLRIKEILAFHKLYGKNENDDEALRCITCGDVVIHNYGTDEYPQCIHCGNVNSD